MKTSSTVAFYSLAAVTAVVTTTGAIFLSTALFSGPHLSDLNDADGPYTAQFFCTFSLINVVFLILLAIAAFHLFRKNMAGISLLSLTLKLELIYYFFGVSILWFLPKPLDMSAAGATGIGNMGISPQIFIAYPITGLIAIWVLKRLGVLKVEQADVPNEDSAVGPSL